jgi:hypothetical protein
MIGGRGSRRCMAAMLLLLLALPASAQYLYGKNKVVYSPREWLVSRSERVELFFYPEEEHLAALALGYADSAAVELEGVFGLELIQPIPLVLYGSQHDFRETNVIPSLIPDSVGGFTDLIRGRVVVPSTGNLNQLRHVIRHELVHAFMLEKLHRVMTAQRQFNYRHPPLWFVEGLAEFYSVGPPGTEGEMLLREGILEGSLPPLRELWRIQGSYLMYKVGQSVLAFLDRNYSTQAVRGLFDNWWRHSEFSGLLELELGMDLEELDRRWRDHMRRRFYPTVTLRAPAAELGRELIRDGGFQFGPAALSDSSFVYLETASGRVDLARADFPTDPRRKAGYELILRGGRDGRTESIPFMRSRPSARADRVVLSVRRGPRDELRFLAMPGGEVTATFAADSLIQIESPALAVDGRVLFSGIQSDGRRDLYLLSGDPEAENPAWRLRRLSDDDHDDRDPAWHPDGERFLFSSDRGAPPASSYRNLFEISLPDGEPRQVTRGPWVDKQPVWAPDGERYLYVSDRHGAWDLYLAEGIRHSRQVASYGGLLDPSWLGEGCLAAVYSRGRYRLYHFPLKDAPAEPALEEPGEWSAAETVTQPTPATLPSPTPYQRRWGLDFARSGLAYDPEFGSAAGGSVGVTDLLGNHQFTMAATNTATNTDEFFKRLNIGVGYANLSRRWNWNLALFHLSSDFDTNGWEYRFERRFGALAGVSYPFSMFRRIEFSANLRGVIQEDEYSLGFRNPQVVLGSIYSSLVHDNVLWGYGGPYEGERINLTLGLTSDFAESGYAYTVVRLDARKYWRITRHSVFASRFMAHFSRGDDPRFFHLGGPLQLRGWPHHHFHARGVMLSNQELRIPLSHGMRLFTPLGNLDLPPVRGSAFFDTARLSQRFFAIPQPQWAGSYGLGLELNLGPVLILRWNWVWTTDFQSIDPDVEREFFLGWNY